MSRKIFIVMFGLVLSLTLALSALTAAPAEGTVVEGVSVPGIALGDSRAQIEAVNGSPRGCHDINELNDLASCSFDATTTGDGYATFKIDKASRGDYRINITYVTKEGYEFDYENSIDLGVISKPK
jgi:hypothetical protein